MLAINQQKIALKVPMVLSMQVDEETYIINKGR